MAEAMAEPSDCEGLWSFSLKFYAHAGVAEALIARVMEDLEERVYGQALTAENGWSVVAAAPDA